MKNMYLKVKLNSIGSKLLIEMKVDDENFESLYYKQ